MHSLHFRIQYSTLLCLAVATGVACVDPDGPTSVGLSSATARRDVFDVAAMTLTTIDVPGSTGTVAMDVNALDEVVGQFTKDGVTHGFLWQNGVLTTIDYPDASFTVAAGINSEGDIVGMYALPSAPTERHGYVLRAGEFTTIDPEGSKFTNALGINPQGDVVGRYCTAIPCGRAGSGTYHGFLWQNGVATSFDVPGAVETNAWKINALGEIIGGFRYAGGVNRLFILRDGEFTTFDLPGALPVAQDDGGINARGDVVGVTCGASPCDFVSPVRHGFVLRDGELTTIDIPDARVTLVLGINARGSLAGFYNAIGKQQGFLLSPRP
jgi:probable HAF family extracellular repeat protein